MEQPLADCPFCGGPGKHSKVFVGHGACSGECKVWAENWNTRPLESALTARLSSAEAEVERLRKRNGELVLHLREALDTPEEELRCGILLHHEWLTIEEEEMARQQEAAARRQQGGTDAR